ncbi:hypothetical protein NE237_002848 [Protea cynaroides]|uniref:Plant thionin family protein n=1 Tax=Protea cynaroides TaxID=273540 RepID=A0A9Q0QS67_9MAGN|nr:hypothetical protein NE237_002848 [Protea cynaroides]
MACNKMIAMILMISALVVMASVEGGESLTDCGKACMPICMRVDGTTLGVCEKSCEEACTTIGGDAKAVRQKFVLQPKVKKKKIAGELDGIAEESLKNIGEIDLDILTSRAKGSIAHGQEEHQENKGGSCRSIICSYYCIDIGAATLISLVEEDLAKS